MMKITKKRFQNFNILNKFNVVVALEKKKTMQEKKKPPKSSKKILKMIERKRSYKETMNKIDRELFMWELKLETQKRRALREKINDPKAGSDENPIDLRSDDDNDNDIQIIKSEKD